MIVNKEYVENICTSVKNNWKTQEYSQNLKCTIFFKIISDGNIESIAIEISSGNEEYDNEAKEAIIKSKPFSPLPEDVEEEYLNVHYEFTYKYYEDNSVDWKITLLGLIIIFLVKGL